MVPLFRLTDVVTRVKMDVDDTQDKFEAEVVGEDYPELYFLSLGQESIPAIFRVLPYMRTKLPEWKHGTRN